VTNLFQRLAWKGGEYQRVIDPHNRLGGSPSERRQIYKDRSPLYSVDKLQIPLLVHVARNDDDVNIEEDMQLVDALRSRKPLLAETKVYDNPPGGHTFDRRVDLGVAAENTPTCMIRGTGSGVSGSESQDSAAAASASLPRDRQRRRPQIGRRAFKSF
jgi:hypothetical protein